MADDTYLYPHSREEAERRDELDLWRDSRKANIACKTVIEAAIRDGFDGMRLQEGSAQSVIAAYGYKRVQWVLANTLQQKEHDGRFSQANKAWAKQFYVPLEVDGAGRSRNYEFAAESHPAVLNVFVNLYRGAYDSLGMFEAKHCEADFSDLDLKGRVLVLSPAILKESCWRQEDQLWLAHDGFGCRPNARGRSIRCTCLGDGEETRWNRHDFIGALKDEHLPEWARERLAELRAPEQEPPAMGGMDMN
jgi:hypothetical protein